MEPEEWTQRLKAVEKRVWENSYYRYCRQSDPAPTRLLDKLLYESATAMAFEESSTTKPLAHYYDAHLPKTSPAECLEGIWTALTMFDTEVSQSQLYRMVRSIGTTSGTISGYGSPFQLTRDSQTQHRKQSARAYNFQSVGEKSVTDTHGYLRTPHSSERKLAPSKPALYCLAAVCNANLY